MTKCMAFWRIIGLFKEGKMHVKLPDGKKITGFKGFKEWCGGKSYSQAMREWNTYETLELLGKKLGVEPCTVLSALNLTTKSLEPLIALRKITQIRKNTPLGTKFAGTQSFPSDVQEKAIDKIIPRLLTKKMKPQEIREAIQEFKPAREKYEKLAKKNEEPIQIQGEAEGEFNSKSLLNSSLEILGILNQYIEAGRCTLPPPYSQIILNIKEQVSKLLDLLEEAR